MREFSNIIADDLVAGLRRDERLRRGTPFLLDCLNLKAFEHGLKPFEPVQDPFYGSVGVSFPFPQLFDGKSIALLAYKNKVEVVDKSVIPWQTQRLPIIDRSGGITSFMVSNPWTFVDLDSSWYLFNDGVVIVNDGSDKLNKKGLRAYCFKDVSIKTGDFNNGRIVFGGFEKGKVWNAEWQQIFGNIAEELGTLSNLNFDDVGESHIMWSSIGGGDFPMWLFFPGRSMYGNFDNVLPSASYGVGEFKKSMLYDVIRRNQFGFMKMPFDGKVMAIKSLGRRLMVYGENGIVGMFPSGGDTDISTYGMIHLSRTGIPDRSYVGGDDNQHIFIDSEGSMWSISGEFNLQRLGYREYISHNVGQPAAIVKNTYQRYKEYYISFPDESFILTNNGLTRHEQRISSITFSDGGFVGPVKPITNKEALVVSNQMDFGVRGIKTVTSVNLSFQGGDKVYAAIDYRYNTSEQFKRTPFVLTNAEGNAVIRAAGLDFRVVVKAKDFKTFELDYLQVKWQSSDKRHIRGTYANPSLAGAGVEELE